MKKIILSIILVSYLAVSSGVIINFHYCMNSFDSAQLFAAENKQCGKCGMHTNDSNGCCRDELKLVKMVDDQKLTAGFFYDHPSLAAVVNMPSEFLVTSFYNVAITAHFLNHSPPLLSEQDTFLQNNVFRI